MTKIHKIRSFLISRFFGLILLVLFSFTALGFLNYNIYGHNYASTIPVNGSYILNYTLSYYSSLIAGTLIVFFSYGGYLVPIFFLIIGFKKIGGFVTNFFIIHLVLFFISIVLLGLLLKMLLIDENIVGSYLLNILENNFQILFINNIFYYLVVVLIFLCFLFSLIYGLSLRINIATKLFVSTFKVAKIILSLFKINYLFIFIKRIFNFKINFKNKTDAKLYKKNKKEPIIEKNKNFIDNTKNNVDNSFSSSSNVGEYIVPDPSVLRSVQEKKLDIREVEKTNSMRAQKLENILKEYGVVGQIKNFKTGPVITLFEFMPAPGVKTSKVVGLAEDIARSMTSVSARISSQPGKNSIGIEIPNNFRQDVYLGDLIKDEAFNNNKEGLVLALGKNISGDKKYADLEKMPHLLIAGTTGSGKSVGINSMILSLLFKFKPSQCKFILIDPKMLELSVYEDIPHLLSPVVTDPKKAVLALKWVVREMENRYRLMNIAGVKNIRSFNDKILKYSSSGKKLYREVQTGIDQDTKIPIIEKQEIPLDQMPLIVVVIDEMADLMMVAGKEVEHLIQRLAQMARASGIHIIAATQRPSVDVITGTIKANFPSRISFRVASRFDSRTILNEMGAEQLLGSGDMLFLENGANLIRLHGGFVSEKEIEDVVKFINSQSTGNYQMDITSNLNKEYQEGFNLDSNSKNVDELYQQAVEIVIKQQKASTSFIQRHLQIGYNRAARIIEKMEEDGIVTEANHVGKRNVLKKNI